MNIKVADLHCDLLSYLSYSDSRSILNEESRCSLPQLRKGGVAFQIMAVFAETTKKSVASAEKQFTNFRNLPKLYPSDFERLQELSLPKSNEKIQIAAAIENASGLCNEKESLESCFTRFDQYREMAGPIVYISLTWNHENRFGGGNLTKVGLKPDGERLLEYVSGKKIAIDLSHTSDQLAHDILNTIDKKGLDLIPIASHSNFRSIADQPRNLTDDIAKEIIRRRGIIGLNFFKSFVGKQFPDDFLRQVDYARFLGGLDHLCFGADFFYDKMLPASLYPFPFYHEPFADAGCYPQFMTYLNEVFTKQEIEKIAFKNLAQLFENLKGVLA
jgi:membrane dipeptidase